MAKGSALQKPMKISAELEAVVGKGPMSRAQVMKNIWVYIKKHDLQDAKNRRNINPDDKLTPVLGKATVNMFEMTKLLSKHIG